MERRHREINGERKRKRRFREGKERERNVGDKGGGGSGRIENGIRSWEAKDRKE